MYQSGFHPLHSCVSVLVHITDDIFKSWNEDDITIILILLDLYLCTFDTIYHRILLDVFSGIGLH